jgi:serine O-acetyltransferase
VVKDMQVVRKSPNGDLDEAIAQAVSGLSRPREGAYAQVAQEGLLDAGQAVTWARRVKRLVLHEWDAEVLQAELPQLADQLLGLLEDVGLALAADRERRAGQFFGRLEAVRALLAEDLEAAYAGDPAAVGYAEILLAYPSLRALAMYRIAHELSLLEVPLLPRVLSEYAHGVTGIDIHPAARIGRRLFIDHGTGVVIGETTVVGDRVRLYQGVTLGALRVRSGSAERGVKRHPTIEEDVTVYAGAAMSG